MCAAAEQELGQLRPCSTYQCSAKCSAVSAIRTADYSVELQDIRRPTILAAELEKLFTIIHSIAPHMGLHAAMLIREVMLACSTASNRQNAGQAPVAAVPSITSIAEWYVATAIRDSRGLKVSISAAR